MRRSAKILILIEEGIIKKISYERRDYMRQAVKNNKFINLFNSLVPSVAYMRRSGNFYFNLSRDHQKHFL